MCVLCRVILIFFQNFFAYRASFLLACVWRTNFYSRSKLLALNYIGYCKGNYKQVLINAVDVLTDRTNLVMSILVLIDVTKHSSNSTIVYYIIPWYWNNLQHISWQPNKQINQTVWATGSLCGFSRRSVNDNRTDMH